MHHGMNYPDKRFLKNFNGYIIDAGVADSEPEAKGIALNELEIYVDYYKRFLPFKEQEIVENQASNFYSQLRTRDELELYLTDVFKRFRTQYLATGDKKEFIHGLEILTFADTTTKAIRLAIEKAFETALTQELDEETKTKTLESLIKYCGSIFAEEYEEAAKLRDAFNSKT